MKNLAHYTLESFLKTAVHESSSILKGRKFAPLLASYSKAYDISVKWDGELLKDINSFKTNDMRSVMESLLLVFKFPIPPQLCELFLKNMHILISANFFGDGTFQVVCPTTEKLLDIKELLIRVPELYIIKSMTYINQYVELIKYIQALLANDLLHIHDREFLTLFSNIFTILKHYSLKHHPNELVANAAILQIIGVLMHRVEGKKYRFVANSDDSSTPSANADGSIDVFLPTENHINSKKNNFIHSDDKFEINKISPKYECTSIPYEEEFKQNSSPNEKTQIDSGSIESTTTSHGSPTNLSQHEIESLVFDDDSTKDAYNLMILLDKTVMSYYNEVFKFTYNTQQTFRMLLASLSYVRHLLNLCGPKCSNHNLFVQYIKEQIYLLLMKVISLSHSGVFVICLNIFSLIITKFRKYVKPQIEIYFNNVIISLIRSNIMLANKVFILESLKNLLKNMDIICYLYVNFDCDKRCYNVFETLINALSKQAKEIDDNVKSRDQHIQCCGMALECLSVIFWQLNLSSEKYWKTHRQRPILNNESNANINSNNNISNYNSPSNLPVNPTLNSEVSQSFLVAKEKKSILDNGIDMFNENPLRGLRFLKSNALINDTPIDIAKFLLETNKLSRVQIGNYLGEPDEEALQIMYAYVESFDFKDKNFLDCLRILLSNFWLPGEAQKIDRIMEKFAGHYFIQNPNQTLLTSADVAYILAYSIIMLTTDLHNQHVKNKITLDQYISLNSKVNNGDDLPAEFLTNIYNSIKEKPINLKAAFIKKIRNDFKMSTISESTIKQLEESINRSEESHSIIDIPHEAVVGPIFQCIWKQCLVSFSVALNKISNTDLLFVPISGVRIAIRVSALLEDSFALDAFLKSLINFTNLSTGSVVSEMKNKHIDAIRAVLTVANEDGNYINDNWFDILTVISNLNLVQTLANNPTFFDKENSKNRQVIRIVNGVNQTFALKSLNSGITQFGLDSNNSSIVSDSVLETISQSILISVDKIFTNTKNLDDDSIVIFVQNLCKVSLNEIKKQNSSRTYMLNKIVEVAHYNMDRIRISWSKIWRILRRYFNSVGCMEDEDIASVCIVSLRQLALRFLEKEELENFHFQKEFLKPFEDIFSRNQSKTIKELILKSVEQIIKVQFHRIRSGWTRLLSVLAQAAQEPHLDIVRKAFTIVCDIINKMSDLVNVNIRDTIVCTLVVFATPVNLPLSNKNSPAANKVENSLAGMIENNSYSDKNDADANIKSLNYHGVDDPLSLQNGQVYAEDELSQREKIMLAFANASILETQIHSIKSAFKRETSRSSILRASFSRNHSIDDPSLLLKECSTDSVLCSRRDSKVDIPSNLGITEEYFHSQREKIAHDVFLMVKVYVSQILAKLSDFTNPSEHYKNPWVTSWVVLFNRMGFLVQNGRGNVGNMALSTLNSILNEYGSLLTQDLWQDIINIYLNIFTICKCSNRDLSNRKKLEWLNKINECAFEGLTGIILTYTEVFNKETIVTFFDFLCYWIRDVELEMLSISSFSCVRILLKELLGKIDMCIYIELLSTYMGAINVTFPHNFIPYSSNFLNESCKKFCESIHLEYVEALRLDRFEKYPKALYSFSNNSSTHNNKSSEQNPPTALSPIMDYASFTNDNLISSYSSILNEKLSLQSSKIRRIYNEINNCQIQVEFMLSLTSILSFLDEINDEVKMNFFITIDEVLIKKWFVTIHSVYSCLKGFINDKSLRESVFKNIISTSAVLKEVYGDINTQLPGVHIQQSTVAGCLLKYAQVILFYDISRAESLEDCRSTFEYIISVYQEIIIDFCTTETNLELWNSTLSIELAHLIHLSLNNTSIFNKVIVHLYDNLCLLISSEMDQNNKSLLSQLFRRFSQHVTSSMRDDS